MNNRFYKFVMEADDDEPTAAELLIFAAIGDWEDMGEVSAKAFAKDLAKLPSSVKRLDLHINSPGGSLFEASAIYSRLADFRAQKVVYIDGLAASAASIVAMVGHKIYIRANANMMIHLPSGIVMGNSDEMRKMAAALDTVTESMINIYADRSGQERDALRDMMANETWFSPEQAVELGFADEVRGVVKAAAIAGTHRAIFNGIEFDLSRYHNLPEFLAQEVTREDEDKKKRNKKKNKDEREPPIKPESAKKDDDEDEDDDKDDDDDEDEEKDDDDEKDEEDEADDDDEKERKKAMSTKKPAANAEADKPDGNGGDKPEKPPTPPPPAPKPPAAAGYDDGVTAERARVAALQKLDRPATHDIIVKAIADGQQPSEVFEACMEAMDKATKQNDRRIDASQLNGIPASDGTGQSGQELGAALAAKVKERSKHFKVRLTGSRN